MRQTGAKRHPCCFRRSLPKEQDSLGESRECSAASGGSSKQWSAWILGSKDFAVTSSGALFHPPLCQARRAWDAPGERKGNPTPGLDSSGCCGSASKRRPRSSTAGRAGRARVRQFQSPDAALILRNCSLLLNGTSARLRPMLAWLRPIACIRRHCPMGFERLFFKEVSLPERRG